MKINAITNTNFRGLFTDKTAENDWNWRMEYRPYSWETIKANKEQIDIYSSKLPTNEEIYIDEPQYKVSKDILGTKSYIKDTRYGQDILRINIDDMPRMNYEDSLKVLDKKLGKFLEMKQEAMQDLKEPLENYNEHLFNISHEHGEYVSDVRRGLGFHVYDKQDRANGLAQTFDKVTKFAEDLGDNFSKYTQLSESADNVRLQRESIKNELNKILEAKAKNALIDISNFDVESVGRLLEKTLQNIEKAKEKLVVLSDRIITVSEIQKAIGENSKTKNIIEYVQKLMFKKA